MLVTVGRDGKQVLRADTELRPCSRVIGSGVGMLKAPVASVMRWRSAHAAKCTPGNTIMIHDGCAMTTSVRHPAELTSGIRQEHKGLFWVAGTCVAVLLKWVSNWRFCRAVILCRAGSWQ